MTAHACEVDTLAVWAVRYALGRMTYAVTDVTQTLIRHKDCLTRNTRAVIVREISTAAAKPGGLGMPMDAQEWWHLDAALRDAGV